MPLYPDDRQFFMVQGFNDKIRSVLGHPESFAHSLHRLVVGAVDRKGSSIKLRRKSPRSSFCCVDSILTVPGMNRPGVFG